MSFFANIDTSSSNFELGVGQLEPIPDNTKVMAVAEEVKNDEYQMDRYIKIKWRISQPSEYANRVIFQKLKVYDAAKGEAHKRMLSAIAVNAGGQLFEAMKKSGEDEPSDLSLSTIANRPMVLQLGVWELEDKSKNGNWVKAISARKGAAPTPAPKPSPKPAPAVSFDDDDADIEF